MTETLATILIISTIVMVIAFFGFFLGVSLMDTTPGEHILRISRTVLAVAIITVAVSAIWLAIATVT